MSCRSALTGLVVLILSAMPVAAATVNVADGSVAAGGGQSSGLVVPLDASFNVLSGPLTFTGDLTITNPPPAGSFNIGMTFGSLFVVLHPGYTNGAFRLDTVDLGTGTVTGSLTGNTSMGFTPGFGPIGFSVTLAAGSVSTIIDTMITITQGANVYTDIVRSLSASLFGSGGEVSSFGVRYTHNGLGGGPLNYSSVSASSVSAVPLPATLPLMVLAAGGLALAVRRRRRGQGIPGR